MFNNEQDILSDLTGEINLADAFIMQFNKNENFNKLDYLKRSVNKPKLTLSKNIYEELETRFEFEFIATEKKKIKGS